MTPLGCFIGYDERGLLGIAFHPNYRHNGLLYTFTSETGSGTGGCGGQTSELAQPNHETVIREWRVDDVKANHPTVLMGSSRELLRLPQPQFNHNGGDLAFGRDGMLYIATGDGGAADDQGVGHVPGGNAQDLSSLYGNILRIDVDGRAVAGAYSIPADNPFVATAGARGEIYAYGFRNPYRMSFDSKTGELYVADVGQNDLEEINVIVAGGNYGWPIKEGTFVFDHNGTGPGFVTGDPSPPGLIDPIAQYDHWLDDTRSRTATEGIAIVGGHVYRGSDVKDKGVRKHYVFGDYSRRFAQPEGRLFVLDDANRVTELTVAGRATLGLAVLGFAEDGTGELYLLANVTGLVGGAAFPAVPTDTGVVLKSS
ncbi:MAG: PQQ-dependent sugar dehydrogenase [Chloroflexi bacterium]|nr:PQQ-dependent sugar dehydrogenase [Chloroflexota bacterium]MDA1003368.1 PQQ-dependent sugar dehydrogenase [Chloroflexota bacterium]